MFFSFIESKNTEKIDAEYYLCKTNFGTGPEKTPKKRLTNL